mmetsp:Transcript_28095/g.59858  ORF Transcript_28095/g.59858 Transcript_28095/m.59858 type:complete len:103 (-) Transcript_28095:82-390(-)
MEKGEIGVRDALVGAEGGLEAEGVFKSEGDKGDCGDCGDFGVCEERGSCSSTGVNLINRSSESKRGGRPELAPIGVGGGVEGLESEGGSSTPEERVGPEWSP